MSPSLLGKYSRQWEYRIWVFINNRFCNDWQPTKLLLLLGRTERYLKCWPCLALTQATPATLLKSWMSGFTQMLLRRPLNCGMLLPLGFLTLPLSLPLSFTSLWSASHSYPLECVGNVGWHKLPRFPATSNVDLPLWFYHCLSSSQNTRRNAMVNLMMDGISDKYDGVPIYTPASAAVCDWIIRLLNYRHTKSKSFLLEVSRVCSSHFT